MDATQEIVGTPGSPLPIPFELRPIVCRDVGDGYSHARDNPLNYDDASGLNKHKPC
jgi:hypothetical protein